MFHELHNWLVYVYEQTCVLIGLSSRFGNGICAHLTPNLYTDRLFTEHLNHIPYTLFRWFINKFFLHFARKCPQDHYERLLKPLFSHLQVIAFQKIDYGWGL